MITVTLSAHNASLGFFKAKIYLDGLLVSTTHHPRGITASSILSYSVDLGTAFDGWSSDRSVYGFEGHMYYFAAYMQELSAADVIDEYNTITRCPGGQIFNVSLFRCVSSYVPQVLGVSLSIESFDRVVFKQCVTVTLGFTPSTTVHDGGTITLTYPSGFFVPGVTPTVAPGASSVAELTATCSATSTTSIVLTTSGATIEKTAFLVTIRGFTMGSATPGALGIIVKTSSDTVASNPVASGFISSQVSSVSFSVAVLDRVAGKTSVPVTLGFTPASPVPVGGTITMTYPSGFFNLPNNPCSVYVPAFPSSSSSIANFNSYYCDASSTTSVVITTSGATLSASAFKVTIYGFKMGSATKNTLGIIVQTSIDKAASIPVESGSVVCPAGSFLVTNVSSLLCTKCSKGYFCPGIGNTNPANCTAGKHCSSTGLSETSGSCLAGSYSPGGATSEFCTPCPAGKYCAGAGLAAVSGDCQAGSYSAGGATSAACTPCPAGKYCAGAGLAAVSGDCQAGSYSAGGATSAACTPCPAGKYCAGAGLASISGDCIVSSFSLSGALSAICTPCPVGFFGNSTGLSYCHRCAFGFVSQKGSSECQDLEHQRIVLTLTGSIQTFAEGSERRRSFIVGLATILDIPERQIAIISVSSGSVIVELAFIRDSASSVSPVQAAIRLQEATSAGKLQEFGMTDLNIGGESVFTKESSSQIPVIVGSSIGVSLSVLLIAVVTIFAIKKMRSRRIVLKDFIQIQEKDIIFDTKFTAHGAYGFVRKGKWNGLDVAVKRMTANSSEEDRQNFIREAKTMHAITHPHCVPLYGVCSSDESLSLVMEFMGGGDLLKLLQDAPPPSHRRISLFRQICSGLNYLHDVRDIIHADIKPSNILLSSDGRTAKIADFGLSRMKVQGGHSTAANIDGTLTYLPPERFNKKTKADRSGDIYAMGCLLWETITCNVIWSGVLLPDLIVALHNKERPDIPANVDPEIANLICDCWAEDPVHRPHAVDLLRRVSELDVNNPDFNKPLDPYPPSYVPTFNSLEDCMRKALDPVIFDGLFADMYMIDAKYNEKSVQDAVKKYSLSETEAKCIILYTMESKSVPNPKTQQFYRLFNQAYRRRNQEKLELFADFSFHFWNGMSKLPDCALPLYRGIHRRLADISDLYDQGKCVHLHEATSCSSSMEKAKERFAKKGGTLLSLINVTQAKSIAVFSLIPDEQEFILDFTSMFEIITALTFEKARSLKNFSSNPHVPKSGDLPDDVDLVVMQFMYPQKTSQDLLAAIREGSSGPHIHANILQDAPSASLTHCKTGQDICNSGHLPSEQTSEFVVLSREKYSEDCLAARASVFVENSLSLPPSDAISVSLPGTVDNHSFSATTMNAALEQPSQFQMSNTFSFSDFSESRQITNPATIFKESIVRASPELAPLSAANDDSFCDENGTPLSESVMASFSPPFKRSVAATNESP